MKKIFYSIFLYFIIAHCLQANDKSASFVTVVSSSGTFIDREARNFAYMNNLKIIGSRVTKQGDNWIKVIKVIPKY